MIEKVIASPKSSFSTFGKNLTILSKMSPMPMPCSPYVGIGSPSPKA